MGFLMINKPQHETKSRINLLLIAALCVATPDPKFVVLSDLFPLFNRFQNLKVAIYIYIFECSFTFLHPPTLIILKYRPSLLPSTALLLWRHVDLSISTSPDSHISMVSKFSLQKRKEANLCLPSY